MAALPDRLRERKQECVPVTTTVDRPASSRGERLMARAFFVCLMSLVMASACTGGAGDQAPAEEAVPRLADVPERPKLTYSVQQRREISEGLAADRENARYTAEVLRHRAGKSALPPPPRSEPEPVPTAPTPPAIPGAPQPPLQSATGEVEATDPDKLSNLLRQSVFGEPDPLSVAPPIADTSTAAALRSGVIEPENPISIAFAEDQTDIEDQQLDALNNWLTSIAAQDLIKVQGHGEDAVVAVNRARQTALALIRLGADAGRIEVLNANGEQGELVQLFTVTLD
ncbi:MAG: hypothetical protein ACFB6S_09020 [Geminicoccaceae bacterium]